MHSDNLGNSWVGLNFGEKAGEPYGEREGEPVEGRSVHPLPGLLRPGGQEQSYLASAATPSIAS